MPVLDDLPVELLREILLFLRSVDFVSICLVSRFFKCIAEPFLYKQATLGLYEMGITSFLHTVLSRPTLAGYVQNIFVTWYHGDDTVTQTPSDTLFAAEAHRLGLTQPWTELSQVILLLHVLPNLRELDNEWCDSLREFFEDTLTRPIGSLPAGLKPLQRFGGSWHPEAPGTTHKMLLALLRLPCLRELCLNMESAEDDTNDHQDIDTLMSSAEYRRMSTITDLRFIYGNVTNSMLSNILQLPRALTHLTYMDSDDFSVPETTTFQAALHHLRPTLQYLHLGWIRTLETPEDEEDDGEPHTIGSLREWPVLRTLRCSLTALVGKQAVATSRLVDVVPAVIRVLEIDRQDDGTSYTSGDRDSEMWTESGLMDHILELLNKKEECGLRELVQLTVQAHVWDRIEGPAEVRARMGAACDACGAVGVRVNVH